MAFASDPVDVRVHGPEPQGTTRGRKPWYRLGFLKLTAKSGCPDSDASEAGNGSTMPNEREEQHSAASNHGETPGVPEDFDVRETLRAADEAASVAHDFIHGLNGVTREQASGAVWTIHNNLRPLFEEADLGY